MWVDYTSVVVFLPSRPRVQSLVENKKQKLKMKKKIRIYFLIQCEAIFMFLQLIN